ncbi:MAG: protein involved in meta-pathway of phenol degradation [Deltaproteobacteria bacterium]|nr:protein involved in meta-pathway of phenol degradation [Deltaproteobacteria bacterium]
MQRKWMSVIMGLAAASLLPVGAVAQQPLPAVNLGLTSFLDGGPPAGPGLYFQEYIQYYSAGRFRDQHGNKTPLLGSVESTASVNQLIYQSDQPILFGGKWGMDVIVPVVTVGVTPGPVPVLTANSGLGDILIGPFIQWDPIMGPNGPIFMHRIELENLVPSGSYDNDRVLNAGSNFYSFNPYWAGTAFILPGWTATYRLHYLWNAKNDDPNTTFFPGADDTQAGQAMHINFASEYEVLPKQLRLGVNGYYLKQFTNSEVDGNTIVGSREQVVGLGPGVLYSFSQNDHLFFNAYFETQAENRPEGIRMIGRWTHHF